MSFKVGDVVRLKSGGSKMKVVEAEDDKECIVCAWESNTVHVQHEFLVSALTICDDSDSSNLFGAPIILGD